jgi:hypothetical protein
LVILDDTEGIDPEALQMETTSNTDSILEGLWESLYLNSAFKVPDVGLVSTKFGVLLGGTPAM